MCCMSLPTPDRAALAGLFRAATDHPTRQPAVNHLQLHAGMNWAGRKRFDNNMYGVPMTVWPTIPGTAGIATGSAIRTKAAAACATSQSPAGRPGADVIAEFAEPKAPQRRETAIDGYFVQPSRFAIAKRRSVTSCAAVISW